MTLVLTDAQKALWAPMLKRTWEAIGSDCEHMLPKRVGRTDAIIELTLDADRPVMYGKMSRTDYKLLCIAYRFRDTETWLRQVLNY